MSFFRLACMRLSIPLIPGFSFMCRMMYSRSEDQNILDMLPLVSCICLQSLSSSEILTFILVPLRTQLCLPWPTLHSSRRPTITRIHVHGLNSSFLHVVLASTIFSFRQKRGIQTPTTMHSHTQAQVRTLLSVQAAATLHSSTRLTVPCIHTHGLDTDFPCMVLASTSGAFLLTFR